jgi:hypothetical protein
MHYQDFLQEKRKKDYILLGQNHSKLLFNTCEDFLFIAKNRKTGTFISIENQEKVFLIKEVKIDSDFQENESHAKGFYYIGEKKFSFNNCFYKK